MFVVRTTLTTPDDGFGFIDPASIVTSVKELTEKFGGRFGGVAGWEYFNSLPGGDQQPWEWASLIKNAMAHPSTRRGLQSRINR